MASWVAVGVIGIIGILTLIRVLLWVIDIQHSHRRRVIFTQNPPLLQHDQLGGHHHLQNVLNSSYDDDVQPLSS